MSSQEFKKVVLTDIVCITQGIICKLLEKKDNELVTSKVEDEEEITPYFFRNY